MKGLLLVSKRELASYFNSLWGYVIITMILMINGLFFNAFAMGDKPRWSFDILRDFFYFSFGTTVIASVFLTMRLIAEEKQNGTLALVNASPLADWQIVVGKWVSALLFVSFLLALSVYMPALVFVNGKVSLGHLFAGYTGLVLVASAVCAIGTFGSALSKSQLVSAVVTGVIVVFLLLTWLLAKIAQPPLQEVLSYLSLFDRHFGRTFMMGQVHTKDVVYYISVTFFFLVMATRWISARRWK